MYGISFSNVAMIMKSYLIRFFAMVNERDLKLNICSPWKRRVGDIFENNCMVHLPQSCSQLWSWAKVKKIGKRVRESATITRAARCVYDVLNFPESPSAGFVRAGNLKWLTNPGTLFFDTSEACLLNYKGSEKVPEVCVYHVMCVICPQVSNIFKF